MKRNLLILTVALFAVSMFSSCSGFKTRKIDNAEDIASIFKKVNIEKAFPDKNVIEVSFLAEDHLKSDFGTMSVYFYDEGEVYYQVYIAGPNTWGDIDKSSFHKVTDEEKANRLKNISDFDFSTVDKHIADAVAFIEENTDEFEGFKLYSIEKTSDENGNILTEFMLNATKKGEGTTTTGNTVYTNYYEFEFAVDENGELFYQGE